MPPGRYTVIVNLKEIETTADKATGKVELEYNTLVGNSFHALVP